MAVMLVVVLLAQVARPEQPPPFDGDGGVVDAGEDGVPVDAGSVADPVTTADAGLASLEVLRRQTPEVILSALRVMPERERRASCQAVEDLLPQAMLRVESVDASGDPVEATVEVDGRAAVKAPFEGIVGLCVATVTVRRPSGELRSEALQLAPRATRVVRIDWGGSPRAWLAVVTGDLMRFDPPTRAVPTGIPPAASVTSVGVRFERWSGLAHGTMGVVATPALTWLTSTLAPELAVIPSFELFIGLGQRIGTDTLRFMFSGQVGLWALAYPSGRATVGFTILEHLVVTASVDLRLRLLEFAFGGTMGAPSFAVGFNGAVGVAW